MSEIKEDTSSVITDSIVTQTIPVNIYLLWCSADHNNFLIQALFSPKVKFSLQLVARLSDGTCQDQNPCVYCLHLDLTKNANDELAVEHENTVHSAKQYQLLISQKNYFTSHFEENTSRMIENIDNSHHFLFDVVFQKSPPGGPVSFWKTLCLFAYYLIDDGQLETFEIFIKQFASFVQMKSIPLTKSHFNDFVKTTFAYFSNKERILTDPAAIINFIRMMGVLPLAKENFSLTNDSARELSTIILNKVSEKLTTIFENMNADKWNLFKDGLTILMSIEIYIDEEERKIESDSISLLSRLPENDNEKHQLANRLFQELMKLETPIARMNWTELITFVDDENLQFNCLTLATTFDHIISCFKRLIPLHRIDEDIIRTITPILDTTLTINIAINLPSIVKILQYLEQQSLTNKEQVHFIQSAIESNEKLRRRILNYLDKLNIQIVHLKLLQSLFHSYNPRLLSNLDKTKYLIQTMYSRDKRSYEFYIVWFECFLCDEYYVQTEAEFQHFQQLLKEWSNKFRYDRQLLEQMTMKIDFFLKKLTAVGQTKENDSRGNYFIQQMIEIYFQHNSIFDIIAKIDPYIQHPTFLDTFVEKFFKNSIGANKQELKILTNCNNPVNRLLELLQQQSQIPNHLLRRLIIRCANEIRPNDQELFQHSFLDPCRDTCTFAILFYDSFAKLSIHQETLDRLGAIWSMWERKQMKYEEIWRKKNYTPDQKFYFEKIWDVVGKHCGKQYQVAVLFETAYKDMMGKAQTKEKITTCLNEYCEQARDKKDYEDLLLAMQYQIEHSFISDIHVPPGLKAIVPLVERLTSFSHSNAWLEYYTNNVQEQGNKRRELMNENHDKRWNDLYVEDDGNLIDTNENIVLPIITVKTIAKAADPDSKCMNILNQATEIFDKFQRELQTACIHWNTAPIQQLLTLFREIDSAAGEIHKLKALIDPHIVPKLLAIVSFWKERSYIQQIFYGIQKLLDHLRLPLDTNSTVLLRTLEHLLTINEQTIGQICFDSYQNYLIICAEKYSSKILQLWSQYHVSYNVLTFLHKLAANDMNHLLEAVNDWDEASISTRTVMDFSILKAFFDQVYTMIKATPRDPSTLYHLAKCFEKIWQAKEFEHIFDIFPTCIASLLPIQQLYLELTNKEQSKRQRIINIMQKSLVTFQATTSKDYKFNVRLHPQKMTFADLSELRDRARLIEHSDGHQYQKKTILEMKQLQRFIHLVNIIQRTLETMFALFLAGHPQLTDDNVKYEFICMNGEFEGLNQLCTKLEEDLNVWTNGLCRLYEIYPEITHFFCEQFRAIENLPNDRLGKGFHLLKYIGLDPEQFRQGLVLSKPAPIERIGRLLADQRINRQETIDKSKVCLIETEGSDLLRAIFSLFHFNKSPARVHQLFYCNAQTNWTEIRAFLYRCFFSQTLQILIRPHLLSSDIQDRFVPLLREFIEHHPEHHFSLGLISTFTTQNIQLINTLKVFNLVSTLCEQDLLNKADLVRQLRGMLQHCTLVTSRLAGLGKTSWIKEQCRRMGKPLIKFTVGGEVQADNLAERLVQYTYDFNTSALHIDIGSVDNLRTLDEILYCLTLFHSFRFGQNAIYLPLETPIFIELDSSPLGITPKDLSICQYLEIIHHREHLQWNELHSELPKFQFVANYLEAINTGTIIKSDIHEANLRMIDVINSQRLIQNQFSLQKNPEFLTWTQLNIFIAVFYSLFDGFSKCGHFLVDCLENPQLRLDILQAFLRSSDQFTSLSVENVRKQQRATTVMEGNVKAPAPILSDTMVRWETTQPFTVVFSATNDPLFVYKTMRDIPRTLIEYFQAFHQASVAQIQREAFSELAMFPDHNQLSHAQFFLKLASLSHKFFNKAICQHCYRQFPYNTLRCTFCHTNGDLLQPRSFDANDIIIFQCSIATSLETQYVLTPDNYIKMLLVFLRVQSGLPVLIMGETGCGKTALIHFLCQIILDDELEIFRMHAGITEEKIQEKMSDLILRAEQYQLQDKRLWVFFDEFNTTRSIGMIKEITCERTLLGKTLPSNMIFLGACNPRRYKPDQILFDDNIGIKKDQYSVQKFRAAMSGERLLYTVVPLPETMLEYVWDYGYLDHETEKKYIEAKLKTSRHLQSQTRWLKVLILLISKSQAFIREIEDVSSVSLRDVTRYCRLFNWFHASILERMKNNNDLAAALRRASITSLLLCYYFRLQSRKHKDEYINMVESTLLQMFRENRTRRGFVFQWLQEEEMDIINRMELPLGTAKNRALLENIFVLLACIVNRIPLVLCGKPGCSKTSAVQIVISNLKGKKSSDSFFQTLPELIAVSYQGSQNCNSKSVEKVFERASKYIIAQEDSSLLPVIVFDEIGLAELSSHNPLKVLHAELEVETCNYGFVGISNWRLDASKMNRTLYLACPDPDNEDLKITSTVIAESILGAQEAARLSREILPGLATAYYQLFSTLRGKQIYDYYFGLRDFYSLIKGVVREIQHYPNADPYQVIRRQLTINFDGIVDGASFMWETFCVTLKREELLAQYAPPNLKQLLDQNLTIRSDNRYLMLIVDSESTIDYVERYIHEIPHRQNQMIRTLVGSQMPGDLLSTHTYTETYSYRVLMDIILYAETSMTLVMRQLGHLYDSLYDLFNQNFAISGRKKYCRIALGTLYHPRCLVNEEFYCVVFVNQQDVEKCDPPFLNRFEKHLIRIEDFIQPQHWDITTHLHRWLAQFIPTRNDDRFPLLQHLFIGYNGHHLCSLVIDSWDELQCQAEVVDEKTVLDVCQEKLFRIASFDLVLTLVGSNIESKEIFIQQYYDIHARTTLAQVIKRAAAQQIIYTYTQIYDQINYDHETIEEIELGNLKTELELINKIKTHYQSDHSKRFLFIRVDYRAESKQLLSLKHILLNAFHERHQHSERNVWLIMHCERNMLDQATNDVLFNHWAIDMIDDLNAEQLMPKDLLFNPSYLQLARSGQFPITDCLFDQMIARGLSKLHYTLTNQEEEHKINQRRNTIIDSLVHQNDLREILQENLMILMESIPHRDRSGRYSDWREDVLSDARTIVTCRSWKDACQTVLLYFYDTYMLMFLAHLERYNFFDSYLFILQRDDERIRKIWFECLQLTLEKLDRKILNQNRVKIRLTFDLQLPCAVPEYEVLQEIRRQIQQSNEEQTTEQWIFQQFQKKSFYPTRWMQEIPEFFDCYWHDQLLLFLHEHRIHLPVDFVCRLIIRNDQLRLKDFLANDEELVQIFRIFEKGWELIEEETIEQMWQKQFIRTDEMIIEKNELYYTLVVNKDVFYQLPPGQIKINNQLKHRWSSDPLIETSIMNLIELILSSKTIENLQSIEHLTTVCSLICQGVIRLSNYTVDNLEKLRSLVSLVRCITSLNQNRALKIFQQVYAVGREAMFQSCQSIHAFIKQLVAKIDAEQVTTDQEAICEIRVAESAVKNKNVLKPGNFFWNFFRPNRLQKLHPILSFFKKSSQIEKMSSDAPCCTWINSVSVSRTVSKLEVDLLHNWLADHGDGYCEILQLIEPSDSPLWQYSAKIFSYILQKLQLHERIEQSHGRIAENKDDELLEEYLQNSKDRTEKIERLFVDRIHMNLMLNSSMEKYEEKLSKDYPHFKENLQLIIDLIGEAQQRSRLRSIGLLSWLKHYASIYAIALANNSNFEIMLTIDHLLANETSAFGETLKLFILKQLLHLSGTALMELCTRFLQREVLWLQSVFNRLRQMRNDVREEIIMPAPLFEGHEKFLRVNVVLNKIDNINEVRTLITECGQNQPLMYSVYLWFIQQYVHFISPNAQVDKRLSNLIQTECRKLLSAIFQPIGFKFIVSLCTNFTDNSYFHLHPKMSKVELHNRLRALNIAALGLSTCALSQSTHLGTLFFNNQRQMPRSYVNHLQSVCVLGFVINDPVATQMMNVKTRIQALLDTKQIQREHSFVYQCSAECRWVFYFENCGQPASRTRCPLCKNDIGAQQYGRLIPRHPPQIQWTIDQGFQTIDQYLDQFNHQVRFGYHQISPANQTNPDEKSDHLNRAISFRFIHMITHAQLLVLFELDYLSIKDLQRSMHIPNPHHFQEHYEKDFEFLSKSSTDPEQCYIWLYKLINHMLTPTLIRPGLVDTQTKVLEMEQSIEQNIIFPHIFSLTDEINQYRVAYAEFMRQCDARPHLIDYLEELQVNEQLFPFLLFFNKTRILTTNYFQEFTLQLNTLPFSEKLYPITTFILKRLDAYVNIQHLYSIVEFTNYLLQKYNHRIKRYDAAVKTLDECLKESRVDGEMMQIIFQQFLHAWYQLDLKQVHFGCQAPSVVRPTSAKNFRQDTTLAPFLLNTSKDATSILVVAYIHTLSKMQNEMINYFDTIIQNEGAPRRQIPVQAIGAEHVFRFDANDLNSQLIREGFVINFEYGKGMDLIYDYEEVEMTLRRLVSNIYLLDCEHLQLFNYQFELYAENTSLITQIRQHIPQQSLSRNERMTLSSALLKMNNDEIIHLIGSLDHMFTYLCNVETNETHKTLHAFVEEHIKHQFCLYEQIFRRQPFSTISLTQIIPSYELMEEIAFDKVLRTYIRTELKEAKWTDDVTFEQFAVQTYDKANTPETLKSLTVWIGMLKRLLIRVLNATIDLNIPLQFYLERIDLWNNDVSIEHLQVVELPQTFLLQHTYIILCELEVREKVLDKAEQRTAMLRLIPNVGEQRINHLGRFPIASHSSIQKVVLTRPNATRSDKKLRI